MEDVRHYTMGLFGVAHCNGLSIFDQFGVEVHFLQSRSLKHLQYLKYHYLSVDISQKGLLRYLDISTGKFVAQIRTKIYDSHCLFQSKQNGMVGVSSSSGVVSFFSPNQGQFVMKSLCHSNACISAQFSEDGDYFVTCNSTGQLKVFDVRMMRTVCQYYDPENNSQVQISQ